MSMYDSFQTDKDLERNGIVVDYGEFRVTVARAGGNNKRYLKLLDAKMKPYKRAYETDTLSNEIAVKILHEAYAQGVVTNWEVLKDGEWVQGIEAPDGSIMEFNADNVLQTFRNLPDLFQDIKSQAEKAALYRQAIQEAESGN